MLPAINRQIIPSQYNHLPCHLLPALTAHAAKATLASNVLREACRHLGNIVIIRSVGAASVSSVCILRL